MKIKKYIVVREHAFDSEHLTAFEEFNNMLETRGWTYLNKMIKETYETIGFDFYANPPTESLMIIHNILDTHPEDVKISHMLQITTISIRKTLHPPHLVIGQEEQGEDNVYLRCNNHMKESIIISTSMRKQNGGKSFPWAWWLR